MRLCLMCVYLLIPATWRLGWRPEACKGASAVGDKRGLDWSDSMRLQDLMAFNSVVYVSSSLVVLH